MKAAFFKEHGGSDKIIYGDYKDPAPEAGDVVVRVKACALNHVDMFDLTPEVLARALKPFPVSVRTLDALLLATIEFLRGRGRTVKLASYDTRLSAAAKSSGAASRAGEPRSPPATRRSNARPTSWRNRFACATRC